MAADKKCVSRRDFLAGAAMAAAALAGCSAGSGAKAELAAKWGFERDDDLPLLCMEVSGGSVVAATGDGWAPNGDFVQLHLGGGSIPGTQVKSVTSETDGTRLTVVLESGGVSTLDDVKALADMNLYGAILGKALYTGAIDLADAVRIVSTQDTGAAAADTPTASTMKGADA